MITLYDYLPSQNAWKIRQLLAHLEQPYATEFVSIFEGEGQRPEYLAVNPTGAVPAIRLEDGRVLAESNAILCYLADGGPFFPLERYARAKVLQWLSFEADYVQVTIGSLRYWTLTGKLGRRSVEMVEAKAAGGRRALSILDRELSHRPFIAGEAYTIADISLYAYAHLARDAELDLAPYPAFVAWLARVQAQPRHLAEVFPYSIDPASSAELP